MIRLIALAALACSLTAQIKRFPWRPAPTTTEFSCSLSPTQIARRTTTTDYQLVTSVAGQGTQRVAPAYGDGPICDETFGGELLRLSQTPGAQTAQLGHIGFSKLNTRFVISQGGGLSVGSLNPTTFTLASTGPQNRTVAIDSNLDGSGAYLGISGDHSFWSMIDGEETILYTLSGMKVLRINVDATPDFAGKLPVTVAWDFSSLVSGSSATSPHFYRVSPDATTTNIFTSISANMTAWAGNTNGADEGFGYLVFNLRTGAVVKKFINGIDAPNGTDAANIQRYQELTVPTSTGSFKITLYNDKRPGYKASIDSSGDYIIFSRSGFITSGGTIKYVATVNEERYPLGEASEDLYAIYRISTNTWTYLRELGHASPGYAAIIGHDVNGRALRYWNLATLTGLGTLGANAGANVYDFARAFQIDYSTWGTGGSAITAYTCAGPINPFTGPPQTYDCLNIGANELVAWKPDGTFRRFAKNYMNWTALCPGCTLDGPTHVYPLQPVRSQDGKFVMFVTSFNASDPTAYSVYAAKVPQF